LGFQPGCDDPVRNEIQGTHNEDREQELGAMPAGLNRETIPPQTQDCGTTANDQKRLESSEDKLLE